jgi:uncharacterized repeat protein (TIGR03803 family)
VIPDRLQARALHSAVLSYACGGARLFAIQLLWLALATPSLQAQVLTLLHSFSAGKADGRSPYSGLMWGDQGNLYGTTFAGGSFDRGTVFRIDAQGRETILHNFWGGDGLGPVGALVRDRMATLYGTALNGGTPEGGGCIFGCGAVFTLDKTGKEDVLYAFSGGADGWEPTGDLTRDEAGNVYGITELGGDFRCAGAGCGVVFKVNKTGKETVLHTFTGPPDGSQPSTGLVRDKAGNLYGVTFYGGITTTNCNLGCGTVFKVDAKGNATILYSFTAGTDGGFPNGSLIRDASGNLYGVTAKGGDLSSCTGRGAYKGCGVIFKLDTTGKETVLYAFKGSPDGAYPDGGLLRDKSGNLYGATNMGGTTGCSDNFGCGTIFKLDTNGREIVLYTFTAISHGAYPNGGLIMDQSGNLYGTTSSGGNPSCYCGVVFKLTP